MSSNDGIVNESRVPRILAGIIIPTLLSSVFVVARLYTRTIITKNWGHDDSLITIAWISSLGLAVTNALLIPFGGGHHVAFQKLSQVVPTLKLVFFGRLIYQFTLCITKLGICVFYLRVFQDKRSERIVYLITAFTIVSALVIEFVFIFQCNPVSDAWSITRPNCKPANPSVIANAVCNIAADIWIMVFVIPRVLPLQMALRQKVSLLVVVSLGLLAIVSSIIRCLLVTKLADNNDPTWNGSDVTTWTTIEVATGLFCASAPCIRPLLRQIAPRLLSSMSQTISGPSKGRAHTGPSTGGSKLGLGSVRALGKREEAFELGSREERGTFWVEDDDSGLGKRSLSVSRSDGDIEAGEKSIVKTVSVSVTAAASSARSSAQKRVHEW